MFLLVYVDDLLLVASDMSQLRSVKAALGSRFEMKDMGEAEFILGVQIRRDRQSVSCTSRRPSTFARCWSDSTCKTASQLHRLWQPA